MNAVTDEVVCSTLCSQEHCFHEVPILVCPKDEPNPILQSLFPNFRSAWNDYVLWDRLRRNFVHSLSPARDSCSGSVFQFSVREITKVSVDTPSPTSNEFCASPSSKSLSAQSPFITSKYLPTNYFAFVCKTWLGIRHSGWVPWWLWRWLHNDKQVYRSELK